MSQRIEEVEAIGQSFSVDRLLEVRARTWQAISAVAAELAPGMSEDHAKQIARATLTELGLRRGWHRIVVRCGENTTKSFSERSLPGVVLASDDIFFVDIGPIYDGFEGDAGQTFVLGEDPEHHRAVLDVRSVWDMTRRQWLEEGSTGAELYRFAATAAEELGWRLNLDLSGHRLSEFPHSAHYDGSLAEVEHPLRPDRWVLEIAITHPARPFGAFYEDLLLEDQSLPGSVSPLGG